MSLILKNSFELQNKHGKQPLKMTKVKLDLLSDTDMLGYTKSFQQFQKQATKTYKVILFDM